MVSKKRMYLHIAMVGLYIMCGNFAHPITPTLIVERGLDSSMFGVALAAMMTMNFCFSPFWGKMAVVPYLPLRRGRRMRTSYGWINGLDIMGT